MAVIDAQWLEHLSDVAGAKVEVDQDGGVVVSPASDPHVLAASHLLVQLGGQVPDGYVTLVEGPRWSPVGEPGPSYVPDLTVVERRSLDRVDFQLSPPPLLVVEILSPSTRRRDHGEKAEHYYLGGATVYWTLELPGADISRLTLHARGRALDGWTAPRQGRTGVVTWPAGTGPFPFALQIDLDRLA